MADQPQHPVPHHPVPPQPAPPQPSPPQPAPPYADGGYGGGYPTQPPAHGAPTGYAGPPAYQLGSPWGPLADWGTRVLASLIDSLVQLIALVPYVVGIIVFVVGAPHPAVYDSTGSGLYEPAKQGDTGLMVVGGLLFLVGLLGGLGVQLWNRVFTMGRTGQSIGKKAMGIMLVEERTGQPMGAGMCFVRELAHFLDGAVYIGYLWPLWDKKRQTFADMILSTVVIHVPKS
jgi:uncharacterized RDD family membrane protein YckC